MPLSRSFPWTFFAWLAIIASFSVSCAQAQVPPAIPSVLGQDALLSTPVGGLEKTGAQSEIVDVTAQPFQKALRVTIKSDAAETNATQLTILNALELQKGDALMATLWVRGESAQKTPAQLQFLFEKATDPWTKSVSFDISTPAASTQWKRIVIPFSSADNFAPGEAMASIRFAFGPQTVEVGGLSLVNYAKTKTADELIDLSARENPLGKAGVTLDFNKTAQKMGGFGGNFPQPRYGATEPMDAVGQFNLDNLDVAQARIGIPLNDWTPERGVFKDEGPAHAAFLQLQMLAGRQIPLIGSVWEGPKWLVGGEREQSGKTLPRERYGDCIDAIARFLIVARDKYHAPVDYFSFNEADLGINFKFSSSEIADFIAMAGPRFEKLGLKTRFLVGDTANGTNCPDYVRPLLENRTIAPYLGPIAFHCWDALGASDGKYREIAALGKQFNKEIWCTEAGHDAALWQQSDPWQSWDNALRTALAYERTLRLTGASVMDYWTYQDNYRLLSADAKTVYPVWHVVRTLEKALAKGNQIVSATSDNPDLKVIAAKGQKAGQFSLVLINPLGAGEVTVRGLPKNGTYSTVRNSAQSPSNGIFKPTNIGKEGSATFELPARSILTILSGSGPPR